MLRKINPIAAALLILLYFSGKGFTQDDKKAREYSKYPRWIEMMNDTNVNYFEAVKAFEIFWKTRAIPEEQDEMISQNGKEKKSRRERRQEQESEKYRFEYKKFKHWQLLVEPYVQADGRILSADEQLEIWKKQRE